MENVQNNYLYWKSQLDCEEVEEDAHSNEERGDDSETETLRDSEDMTKEEGRSDMATTSSRLSGCDRTLSGTDRRLSATDRILSGPDRRLSGAGRRLSAGIDS